MIKMAKAVAILYFSGSGNTEALAKLYVREFEARGNKVDLIKVEEFLRDRDLFNPGRYDLIGIGYPVHAFGVPKIMAACFKALPFSVNKKVFTFKSPGDPFVKGGATTFVRSRLGRKGYEVFNEATLVMASNLLIRYPDALIKQLYEHAVKIITRQVAEALLLKRRLQRNTLGMWCLTAMNPLEHFGCSLFGRGLRAAKRECTLCEKCIKACPTTNIHRKGQRIKFGWRCTFCVRCFYVCPSAAINAPWFKAIKVKDWYDLGRIVGDDGIKGDFVHAGTKGYYRGFYKYFEAVK